MALVPIIITAAKVAQKVYKYRKTIYAVLTAQDKYISKSFKYGGYGKATNWGVRSGALAGSVIGQFINNAEDTPGNGIQKPFHGTTPGTPNKARFRQPVRYGSRNRRQYCFDYRGRRSGTSKRRRS